jgi:hypothetical protein
MVETSMEHSHRDTPGFMEDAQLHIQALAVNLDANFVLVHKVLDPHEKVRFYMHI